MLKAIICAVLVSNSLLAVSAAAIRPPCDVSVARKSNKIVGGDAAEQLEFPYQVSFQDDLGHYCGGSIIDAGWVLTAAHCNVEAGHSVVIGAHSLSTAKQFQEGDDKCGEIIKVEKFIPHSKYNDRNECTDNDIALVKLARNTKYYESKIEYNTNPRWPLQTDNLTVTGWGKTAEENKKYTGPLQKVNVTLRTNEQCQEAHPDTSDCFKTSLKGKTMMCASSSGKDSCAGDSGGPLVVKKNGKFIQVGVVSWGVGCAKHYEKAPGVYARVSTFSDWIKNTMNNNRGKQQNFGAYKKLSVKRCSQIQRPSEQNCKKWYGEPNRDDAIDKGKYCVYAVLKIGGRCVTSKRAKQRVVANSVGGDDSSDDDDLSGSVGISSGWVGHVLVALTAGLCLAR